MSKSTVNKAGNYTKPGMRKRKFQQIKAGSKGGPPGVWSARKAQLLARSYKAAGGGYKEEGGEIKQMSNGGMAKSQKSLKNWSDADWDYVSKGDEKKPKSQRGRYLPKSVRDSLTPSQKASTNAKKRAASSSGKTSAKYSKDVAKKVAAASKFSKGGKTPAWQRKEGKNPSGGLNAKGVASYRAANPGSKLKTAFTTKPSKLKKGSKAANRRKSFCARMSGMKSKLTSSKTANDPNSRINKSLRKWNCGHGGSVSSGCGTKGGSMKGKKMAKGGKVKGMQSIRAEEQPRGDKYKGMTDKQMVDTFKAYKVYDAAPPKTIKKAKGGSLKPVDKSKNPGLSKLPTSVRNKMGYMKEGGVAAKRTKGMAGSKPKMSFMDAARAVAMKEGEVKRQMSNDVFKSAKALAAKMKGDNTKPKEKVAKMMDGGAVKAHLGSVHKAAGESVATYQASNSNYKEGQ